MVVLPNITTSQARVKVEATGNIFFDVSHVNFSILPAYPAVFDSATLLSESCGVGNGAIDANETVTVSFALRNTGTQNTTNLVGTLLATNGLVLCSGPQTYGMLVAGGSPVAMPFSFTATGTCGGAITAQLQLQDGSTNLGTIFVPFNLGGMALTNRTFSNSAAISIPSSGSSGKAGPYPSVISVSGVSGQVAKVTVTLLGLRHTYPDDIDVLLVGPTGQSLILMSDSGGAKSVSG